MSESATLSRFSGRGYVNRLKRHGFEEIGSGGGDDAYSVATIALARPGSSRVIKVCITPSCDPWPLYAAWCLRRPGPFRPVVHTLRWHGRGLSRFYVATMDRLYAPLATFNEVPKTPLDRAIMRMNADQAGRIIRALNGWYEAGIAKGIDRRNWRTEAADARMTTRLAKRFAREGLGDLAGFIRELASAFPTLVLDPAPHNWMFTDYGRLVMLDPFTRIIAEFPETDSRLVRRVRV